jgi:hypothetical protein
MKKNKQSEILANTPVFVLVAYILFFLSLSSALLAFETTAQNGAEHFNYPLLSHFKSGERYENSTGNFPRLVAERALEGYYA